MTYKQFDYDFDGIFDMANKLFCTFSTYEDLEPTISVVKDRYDILFNKIFVLYSSEQDEYAITYNVEIGNISNFLPNTILVHRKKQSNTLYTINALNILIKQLNGGILDIGYEINWNDYKNCLLLTKGSELKKVDTKLHKMITV